MPSANSTDLTLRRAEPEDIASLAAMCLASRRAASMPPVTRTEAQVRERLAARVAEGSVWVAESGALEGMLDLANGWLESLYVAPGRWRRGVGSALLDLAKASSPEGFGLWVFADNEPARAFYRLHGLVELEQTDGADNDEGVPDVRVVWPGRDPIGHLRGLMDEVDRDLAAVIARRVALTRAIQGFKDVSGHAGRDPSREAEIAARMAARAPVLDHEAWQRIVHEIISVTLDRLDEPEGH